MSAFNRRYDIDWIRVIAIGLLLVYHAAIGFQPWGIMLGFITNTEPSAALWAPMTMLNVWRIPLLFYVSGMGVFFAMQNRDWKQLLRERGARILIPFMFGMCTIVPLHIYLWGFYNNMNTGYHPNPGHLWFLGNIFIYTLIMLPILFYLKNHESSAWALRLKNIFATPLGLIPVLAVFIAEAIIVNPVPYELYAATLHGFVLGLIAFITGFLFVYSGTTFWSMLLRWRSLFPIVAVTLYILRLTYFAVPTPGYLLTLESNCWILSIFAFGHQYLNRPGKALQYLSAAAYPVYVLHMGFQSLGALLLFPLAMDAKLKFVLLLLFTALGCFLTYEFIIRRLKVIRILFGLPASPSKVRLPACNSKQAPVQVL